MRFFSRHAQELGVFLALAALATIYSPLHGGVEAGDDPKPVPQLNYMVRKGLDPDNNPIDRLLNLGGFVCERNPLNPRPCRLEKELVILLKGMSPRKVALARELSTLGAVCRSTNRQLNCLYERQVENSMWLVGSDEPITVFDELLRIDIKVSGVDDALQHEVIFNRTSRPRPRNTYR